MIDTARRPPPAAFRTTAIASGAVACALVVAALVWWARGWPLGIDSAVYRSGALAVLNGEPLYERLTATPDWSPDLPFAYPPSAALVFLPLAALPTQLAWGVLAAATALGLGAVARVVHPGAGWALPLLLVLEPVWRTIGLGQVNVVLMALVLVDLVALRGSRFSGVLVGLAAAIKLTPLVFVLHLLVTRRGADALRALGAFALAGCAGFALLPGDAVRYWSSTVFGANSALSNAWSGNQSLNGLVRRFAGDSFVLVLLVLAGVVGAVFLARALDDRGDGVGAVLVTAFCGLLVSPISWTHHWVWVFPLCLVVLGRVRRPWSAVVGIVALFSGWTFAAVPRGDGRELAWTPLESLVGNAYVLGAVVGGAVVVHAVRARRRASRAGLRV